MREVATGVWQLSGLIPHAINAYLVEDVLVDARLRVSARGLLRQLSGRSVARHVITHAHPDHFGASRAVCSRLGIPAYAGVLDAPAIESGRPPAGTGVGSTVLKALTPPTPACPIAGTLREGDDVAGFVVLDTPGHSPGHISLWRESDRVLIVGDVFFNLPRPGPPYKAATHDPAVNRESMRRLAQLRPALALFGHGKPLRDPAEAFARATAP